MKLSEISEDQQLNELLPALGAIGGAVAKGAASAVGGAMAKGAMNLAKPAQAAGGAAKPPAPGQPPAAGRIPATSRHCWSGRSPRRSA